MQKWRADETKVPHAKIVYGINQALVQAGMFEKLDTIFADIQKRVDKIVIITNAGSRTVDNFYLTHCLPQLRLLLVKHDIRLASTEEWVLNLGPPPNPDDEDAFREFYTDVKYREFKACIARLLDRWPQVSQHENLPMLDVVSIGDQMCEISAACRLGDSFAKRIRFIKLVLILDPTNSRFSYQDPLQFVAQLSSLRSQILRVLNVQKESLMDPLQWSKTTPNLVTDFTVKEGVSYWVPQPKSLTYAVGKPGRFPTEFPFYLPVEYLNIHSNSQESNDEGGSPSPMERTTVDATFKVPHGGKSESEYADLSSALISLDPNSVLKEELALSEPDVTEKINKWGHNPRTANLERAELEIDVESKGGGCEHLPSQTDTTSGTAESAEEDLDAFSCDA